LSVCHSTDGQKSSGKALCCAALRCAQCSTWSQAGSPHASASTCVVNVSPYPRAPWSASTCASTSRVPPPMHPLQEHRRRSSLARMMRRRRNRSIAPPPPLHARLHGALRPSVRERAALHAPRCVPHAVALRAACCRKLPQVVSWCVACCFVMDETS
jgi:hypothetical protein